MFENADRYPFLRRLQDNHQLLTREFLDIVRSAGRDALTTRVHGRERRSSPVHPKKSLGWYRDMKQAFADLPEG